MALVRLRSSLRKSLARKSAAERYVLRRRAFMVAEFVEEGLSICREHQSHHGYSVVERSGRRWLMRGHERGSSRVCSEHNDATAKTIGQVLRWLASKPILPGEAMTFEPWIIHAPVTGFMALALIGGREQQLVIIRPGHIKIEPGAIVTEQFCQEALREFTARLG